MNQSLNPFWRKEGLYYLLVQWFDIQQYNKEPFSLVTFFDTLFTSDAKLINFFKYDIRPTLFFWKKHDYWMRESYFCVHWLQTKEMYIWPCSFLSNQKDDFFIPFKLHFQIENHKPVFNSKMSEAYKSNSEAVSDSFSVSSSENKINSFSKNLYDFSLGKKPEKNQNLLSKKIWFIFKNNFWLKPFDFLLLTEPKRLWTVL